MNDKPTLMVIDGHSLAFRAFYALPVDSFVTPDGQHTNAIHGFISMFLGLLKKENPSHVAVAFDISRYSFRTRVYPDYKATRGETPAEFIGQIPLLQEALGAMGVVTLTKEDFEADDILATLADRAAAEGMNVLVVSGDRDTLQLVNERVTVLYPSARGVAELKRYTPDSVMERYGVEPSRYPDVAALVGETSDNLIGIDKVGEKTAVKWIQAYGSLENLLEHAEEITGVVGTNLREQRARAVLNRELNHLLTDVDLGVDMGDLERAPIDPPAVKAVFGRLAFKTLTERVLALAGHPESPPELSSAPVRTLEMPPERSLVDEELANWLIKNKKLAIGIVIRPTLGGGVEVGLATPTEALRVPIIPKSPDHAPLVAAMGDPEHRFVAYRAKETTKLVSQYFSSGITLVGDPHLAQWLLSPSGKSPSFEQLCTDVLGIAVPVSRVDQLVPEDNPLNPGTEAWCALALWDRLWEQLDEGSQAVFSSIEAPLVPLLAGMETAGIAVDVRGLNSLEAGLAASVASLEADAFSILGHEVNLGSPKQLQTVLFEELGMPKTRATKTGFSTDAQALQDLQESNPHPFVDALLAHRDATKLRQIVEGLRQAVGGDERIHTTFDQTGTSTGRLSSLEPNLQNIPVRTEIGRHIRGSFVAGGGSEGLLTADYSQIEMRIMAHLSSDQGLIEAFQAGEDLHRFVGARIFNVKPEEVSAEMRTTVKAMSYGLAYGLSAFGLAKQLRIPAGEAKELMTEYFRRFGNVREYLRSVVEQAKSHGYTETLFGRRRPFPDLASPNRIVREAAERAALNAPIQGTAADIIKRAMVGIAEDMRTASLGSVMVLQVHDELVFEISPGEREAMERIVVAQMSGAANLAVPLEVQLGWGANWDAAAH